MFIKKTIKKERRHYIRPISARFVWQKYFG